MNTVVLPKQVMRCLGVKLVLVTNAAGGLKEIGLHDIQYKILESSGQFAPRRLGTGLDRNKHSSNKEEYGANSES